MPFVAILERPRPGVAERLIALITVVDGKTVWIDAKGQHDYSIVPPTVEGLRGLEAPISQGNRRGVFFPESTDFARLRDCTSEPDQRRR